MANYNVTLDLNFEDMIKASADIKKLERAVDKGIQKGIVDLVKQMEIKMDGYLAEYGLAGSKLAKTIELIPEKDGIRLNVAGEYATFVEYGTGIVGKSNKHPKPEGYVYDEHGHGEKGWVYPKDDGTFAWTKGQVSKPFVYKTWLWGTRSAHQIIMKNVNREVKKKLGGR